MLGEALKGEEIDVVYSSPLRRAAGVSERETTKWTILLPADKLSHAVLFPTALPRPDGNRNHPRSSGDATSPCPP